MKFSATISLNIFIYMFCIFLFLRFQLQCFTTSYGHTALWWCFVYFSYFILFFGSLDWLISIIPVLVTVSSCISNPIVSFTEFFISVIIIFNCRKSTFYKFYLSVKLSIYLFTNTISSFNYLNIQYFIPFNLFIIAALKSMSAKTNMWLHL